MNDNVQKAHEALREGWTVEIDRSRPGEGLLFPDLQTAGPDVVYELRVYKVKKAGATVEAAPHSICAIDADAARDLVARGAVLVRPTMTEVTAGGDEPVDGSLRFRQIRETKP